MKKSIFISIIAFCAMLILCNSCSPNTNKTPRVYDDVPDVVLNIDYNGHKYIMMKIYRLNAKSTLEGLVHDPDCPCHNNK